MKKDVNIIKPLIRLLFPFVIGFITYSFLLLINNSITEILLTFSPEEYLFCLFLVGLVQEVTLLVHRKNFQINLKKIVLFLLLSTVINSLFVTAAVSLYFKYVIGFNADNYDYLLFGFLYLGVCLFYCLLSLSNHFMQNATKLFNENERQKTKDIVEKFKGFKQTVSVNFLVESLEAFLALVKHKPLYAELFINDLSKLYRHLLRGRDAQFVPVKKELAVVKSIEGLYKNLPVAKVMLSAVPEDVEEGMYIQPGLLFHIVDRISRSSIVAEGYEVKLSLRLEGEFLQLEYEAFDKLDVKGITYKLKDLSQNLRVIEKEERRIIQVPLLKISDESSNY